MSSRSDPLASVSLIVGGPKLLVCLLMEQIALPGVVTNGPLRRKFWNLPLRSQRMTMPWTADEAERHTHKAATQELKDLWAKVANERLESTGDEARAIREANAVVARHAERGA
jgi:hypothetical protein